LIRAPLVRLLVQALTTGYGTAPVQDANITDACSLRGLPPPIALAACGRVRHFARRIGHFDDGRGDAGGCGGRVKPFLERRPKCALVELAVKDAKHRRRRRRRQPASLIGNSTSARIDGSMNGAPATGRGRTLADLAVNFSNSAKAEFGLRDSRDFAGGSRAGADHFRESRSRKGRLGRVCCRESGFSEIGCYGLVTLKLAKAKVAAPLAGETTKMPTCWPLSGGEPASVLNWVPLT